MFAIVELDGTVTLKVEGKSVSLKDEASVRRAIKELIDALFDLARLKREFSR